MEDERDKKDENPAPDVKRGREQSQEITITLDEIIAEESAGGDFDKVTEEEVKAEVETLNPDESSMNSRG